MLTIAEYLLSISAFYTPALHTGLIAQWLSFDLGFLTISKLSRRHVGSACVFHDKTHTHTQNVFVHVPFE
jgi:hypothetical protein